MKTSRRSPWIEALDDDAYPPLEQDIKTDITVVGAGIAGVSTAFFLLTQTEVSVTLIDAKKIAHGATGHNAGQVALYFEKPFQEIVTEYGIEKALDAQKALFRGWDLLHDMMIHLDMESYFEICEGYMGVRSSAQLMRHLENKYLRDVGGAQFDAIFIDKEWDQRADIPEHFLDACVFVDTDFITSRLETKEYFPIMMTSRKACVNSALVCQRCVRYLLEKFPSRIRVYEHTPVTEIRLFPEQNIELRANHHRIETEEVILCTNGFENFHIVDLSRDDSRDTDRAFHKNVSGLVGYMAGFIAPYQHASAISYFPDAMPSDWRSEKYFYVTRRTRKHGDARDSLICIGGPDSLVPHDGHYDPVEHDPHEAYQEIADFVRDYRTESAPPAFPYTWHGLMGFTQTGLRCVGQDPRAHHLWYNLGCNGVGIVSSVYGAWKIAQTLSGTAFPPSVFDPL